MNKINKTALESPDINEEDKTKLRNEIEAVEELKKQIERVVSI